MPAVCYFGIRHHGPGCARALRRGLERMEPDAILLEAPPEIEPLLQWLPEATPPVAILVYPPDAPSKGVSYPMHEYSPEWQALDYARRWETPLRLMDLPIGQQIPLREKQRAEAAEHPEHPEDAPLHPMAVLDQALGEEGYRAWWDDKLERRSDPDDLFPAIAELMRTLRDAAPPPEPIESLREACMRRAIRAERRAGRERIAVICGAWHVPALESGPTAREDNALLKGLRRARTEASLIPWSAARLASAGGYGAGCDAPGWYRHLWSGGDATGWLNRAARLLREQGIGVSPAHQIEALRLARALSSMRERPAPGRDELSEAMSAVFCRGRAEPLALIRDELEIGREVGRVPEAAPAVPLQRDLRARQRRLRLPPNTDASKEIKLDLRKPLHLNRSRMLHRLRALRIAWGRPLAMSGKDGTFWERWDLKWHVGYDVRIVEASVWGNTLPAAAAARLVSLADETEALPEVVELLDRAILAGLPEAAGPLLRRLDRCAAEASDVRHLMDALPEMARLLRYGDVREAPADQIAPIFEQLAHRAMAGLGAACASLDDEAAGEMLERIDKAHASLQTASHAGVLDDWLVLLERIAGWEELHGLVRGRALRHLLFAGRVEPDDLERRAGLALSDAPRPAAAWLQGLIRGSGLRLLHQRAIWLAMDRWMVALDPDVFTGLLPVLRRAFAEFSRAERRAMGEQVAGLGAARAEIAAADGVDRARAERVVPVLAQILSGRAADRSAAARPSGG